MRFRLHLLATFALLGLSGCATLGGLGIQAPIFHVASDQQSELRLLGPSIQRPLGGASLRLYARVENPNPVGITLSSLAGTLRLEGFDAADADFPLGLPLQAGGSAVVPLDIAISFANLPGLADVLGSAVTGGEIDYSLRGTARVDAGVLGQPSFGPMTLLEGSVRAQR
ncbi:MAG: LEA type 2 family protein [Gemmatimonadota bacterium]